MPALCFTGHRPKDLFGYSDIEPYRDLSWACECVIRDAVADGIDTVITGGAQGVDQLAFWAAERAQRAGLPIKNVVYMPFKGQEERWHQNDPFGQENYRRMLDAADEIVICGYRDPARADSGWLVSQLLTGRNHDMVDTSDRVVAVCFKDVSDRRQRGGTLECMRYAIAAGTEMVQIDPMGYLPQAPSDMPLDPVDIAAMPERERPRQQTSYGPRYAGPGHERITVPERTRQGSSFRGERYFLSNMYPAPVTLHSSIDEQDHTFRCAEAAFQALKCVPNHFERVRDFEQMDGPTAKRAGSRQGLPLTPDEISAWNERKEAVMHAVVRAKFLQNDDLRAKLVATGDEPLVEENTWGDTEWGICRGVGQNKLGKILEQVREESREYDRIRNLRPANTLPHEVDIDKPTTADGADRVR